MIREWWDRYEYHVGFSSAVIIAAWAIWTFIVVVLQQPPDLAWSLIGLTLSFVALRVGVSVACWRRFHPDMAWATYFHEHHDEELWQLLSGGGPVERGDGLTPAAHDRLVLHRCKECGTIYEDTGRIIRHVSRHGPMVRPPWRWLEPTEPLAAKYTTIEVNEYEVREPFFGAGESV